jgi:hypothetical protein
VVERGEGAGLAQDAASTITVSMLPGWARETRAS